MQRACHPGKRIKHPWISGPLRLKVEETIRCFDCAFLGGRADLGQATHRSGTLMGKVAFERCTAYDLYRILREELG